MSSRLRLDRYVRAARSDLPTDEQLQGALGPLYAAQTSQPRADANMGRWLSRARRPALRNWGVAAGAVTLGALAVLSARVSPPEHSGPRAPQRVQAPLPAPVLSPAPQPEPAPAAAPALSEPAETPPAAIQSVARRVHPQVPSQVRRSRPSAAAAVDREAQLVEAARAALHEQPALTLRLATEHARAYPAGVLAPEREALAIHALVLLGREAQARARLQALEKTFARSIYVTRLHRLLGDPRPAGGP